jgi:hypothetical protein
MTPMTLTSKISDRHPHQERIESAVRELLDSIPDRWLVHIEPAETALWWIVHMKRERDGYAECLFIEAGDQTADGVVRVLRDALRFAE